jgi:hypothetical protein
MISGNEGIYIHSDLYIALTINKNKQHADEGLEQDAKLNELESS